MKLRIIPKRRKFLSFLKNILLLTVGGFLFSFGAQAVAANGGFLTGDIYGLGILAWTMTKTLSPPVWFLIFNVPLFALAWVHVGRTFFFYSIYGMLITTLFSSLISAEVPIHNQFYAAVASGLICGAGIGIMLRSLGSGSGLDVVGMIVNRRWGVGLGQTHLYFNGVLFLGCLLFINIDTVIVSLIQVYLSSVAIEKVMGMFSQRKLVLIMSDRNAEIAKRITRRLGIGATFLDGRGAYSGEFRDVIMIVVNNLQLKRVEEVVFATDSNALYIVENSFAVRGHRDFVVNKNVPLHAAPLESEQEFEEDSDQDAVNSMKEIVVEATHNIDSAATPANIEASVEVSGEVSGEAPGEASVNDSVDSPIKAASDTVKES